MAVAFVTERADDPDTTNGSAFVIGASFTPNANNLLVCVLYGTDNAATYNISTLTSTGLTWVNSGISVLRDNASQFDVAEVWYALVGGSPVATVTTTATWTETVTGCIGWIGEFSGHNTSAPFKQNAKNEAGTTDPSVSLAVAPDSDSLCIAGAQAVNYAPSWTAEAGWTEHQQAAVATPTSTGAVWVNTATPDQSFTATGTDGTHLSWIMEIDAASTAATPKTFYLMGVGN